MPVFLAYDGSINGDWIARYAIRMASRTEQRRLTVLYAEDVSVRTPELAARFDELTEHAAGFGVTAACEVIPARRGVYHGLIDRLPSDPNVHVVCGLRIKSGRRGFLAGTISERLLETDSFNTVAIRVVQPGLLGYAREFLAPVGADLPDIGAGMASLRLLAPDIRHLHLLRTMRERKRGFFVPRVSDTARRRAMDLDDVHRIEQEIVAETALDAEQVSSLVRVADDWTKELVVQAGRLHIEMIYMEVPRPSLRRLFRLGDPVEDLLRETPCDVALHRGAA